MVIDDLCIADLLDDSPEPNRETMPEPAGPREPLALFRLRCHPFQDSVNPNFFFRTDAHENAFIAMKRCVEEDISLGLTTAVSGTGKTLLTQVLLQDLAANPKYRPILSLIYPKMSRASLLQDICSELDIDATKRAFTRDVVNLIQQKIMELHTQGIKLVLLIDEVHFLDADNLHVLRTLSNIEIPEKKLLTVLLFGEDCFLKKLENPIYKSILNRMFTRVQLRELTRDEVEQYVKYRLLLAGGSPKLFDSSCFDALAQMSGGVPREINRICYNAMRQAAELGRKSIGTDLLEG
ncbi:TPA: hypothetical protein DDW35_13595 [Candidatus Sumerlaeota bacterium]|jgi:general secretion pathway protein A|nr:hypothetical protein [Candidatus Sumerlaeota bacterium]